LQHAKEGLDDPSRLTVIQHDPFSWEAYSNEEARHALTDVPTSPWDKSEYATRQHKFTPWVADKLARSATVHPNLFLACQLPNTRFGEQLFVQFMSTSASKMWLWQKGRFQMGFNGPDAFWTVS